MVIECNTSLKFIKHLIKQMYKLFKYTGKAANPDVYILVTLDPKGLKQFIFVNLIKTDFQVEYQYQIILNQTNSCIGNLLRNKETMKPGKQLLIIKKLRYSLICENIITC